MIRHTVLLAWKAEATDEQKRQGTTELANLPAIVPSVRAFASGPDARLAQGNFDFALSADFDDQAGFFAYRDDPWHRHVIQRYILPITAQRVAVQFEFRRDGTGAFRRDDMAAKIPTDGPQRAAE